LAQDPIKLDINGPEHASHANCPKDAAKASHIIGMTVINNQDEKLGKVRDLAVDLESGRIVEAILATGGFIGIGDTLTAVPPEALQGDVARKELRLDANKEKLKGAPKFETSNWAECCTANHLSAVYSYYGEEHDLSFIQASNGRIQSASKLMGISVTDLQDEKVGKVENLLLDLPSGRVVAVIVSSGGFLGMDGELSAVPPTVLRCTKDRGGLRFDTTKERLSSAPHFKANQWPDFSQSGYAAGVYRAYNAEPYFSTNGTTGADNTARNVSDRDGRTLTPLNQGNSQADVKTTAQIRKEIIAAKNISINAQNVKIITINGHVTLRGPVDNIKEKTLIGDIADRIALSENVDNQLQVKLTASTSN
jgi:sporulation protein YlmC with PRC-barrel domain